MCLHKRVISNPVKDDHRTGFDKPYIKVSCCRCPECRKQRSNDWVFRSYWELLYNKTPCFFVTLTYDDVHLPYYHGKPCFNRKHIQNFLKRLRHKIGSFRYLIVPEYGGFFRRPHYHIILSGISSSLNISHLDIYWFIRDTWYYGDMIDIQKMDSVKGSILKAISYVSEYVTKDPYFDLDKYEKDFPSLYNSRISVSKGYGSKFFEFLTPEILKKGIYYLPIGSNGENKKFQIPRYYELKMCYDYSYDPKTRSVELRKNDLGVEVAISKHNGKYVYLLDTLSNIDLNTLSPVYNEIIELCKKYNFASFVEFRNYVVRQPGFKYFLYNRDFISSFTEHINTSLKFDPVLGDFYKEGSVLDDFKAEEDDALYFYNHLSGKEEYGANYRMFNDYLSIFDKYEYLIDSARSDYMTERQNFLVVKKMYAKLRSRPDLYRRVQKYRPNFDIELVNNQFSFKFN